MINPPDQAEGGHANVSRMPGRIGRIEPFDSSLHTWDAYEERLEQYFIFNEVPETKKVSVLVTLIGSNTYALLRNLTAPRKPSQETYADLVGKLRSHLRQNRWQSLKGLGFINGIEGKRKCARIYGCTT